MKRKAVIAGGSGFLGSSLAEILIARGWEVVVLTRHPDKLKQGHAVKWDGYRVGPWREVLEDAEVLINLAGRSTDCRPTRANREAILMSRVHSVLVLGEALRQCDHPPKTWIQASSLAIYGNAGDRKCTEAAPVPEGFPMDVCVAWEEALGKAMLPGMRWVVLRIGFVLGQDGGALPVLARLARWGLGGTMGTGRQWISWLHLHDMDRLFVRAIEDETMQGVYNAATSTPLTNREMMQAIREVERRPWSPPTPAPLVHLGGWLFGSDPNIALTGRRCLPGRLTQERFQFHFESFPNALADLYRPNPNQKPSHEYV